MTPKVLLRNLMSQNEKSAAISSAMAYASFLAASGLMSFSMTRCCTIASTFSLCMSFSRRSFLFGSLGPRAALSVLKK